MAERCQDNALVVWTQLGVMSKDSKKFLKGYFTAVVTTEVLGYFMERESSISFSDPS